MILAVIVLFVGTSVIPGISGNINNISYSGAIEMASLDDPPEEEWNKTFGGGMYDVGYSVQQTTDRGYILAGRTDSYGADGPDIWLIKTDSSGNKIWDKTFGGDNWDDCASVKHTTDGGYILTGFTASYGPGDVWLIKTDSSGNLLWDKTFGGSEADWGVSVQQTDDGGYIIAGVTISYGAGGWDVWLIKTNSNGAMQWNKTFGGLYDEAGWSVQQGFAVKRKEPGRAQHDC